MKRAHLTFDFKILGLTSMLFVSACATPPSKGPRHGLLEGESRAVSPRVSDRIPDTVNPRLFGEVNLTGKWRWPLADIEISSPYGERGRKFHQGVDLRAHMGTPVIAASDGEVVYVGTKIKGYGRMVVLKHRDGFYTVYAHHSKNRVKLHQKVQAGQVIALSGRSGHASGPHLHFELRRGAQSIDPEYALNRHLKSPANRNIASRAGDSSSSDE
ncbi:MAG: M23 family metallopeptidase [Proteobacteria bacterium]|nr:M23 family metallopeptidase [Pseudomonadota bacterium]